MALSQLRCLPDGSLAAPFDDLPEHFTGYRPVTTLVQPGSAMETPLHALYTLSLCHSFGASENARFLIIS